MPHTVNKLLAIRSVTQVELKRVLPRRVGQTGRDRARVDGFGVFVRHGAMNASSFCGMSGGGRALGIGEMRAKTLKLEKNERRRAGQVSRLLCIWAAPDLFLLV